MSDTMIEVFVSRSSRTISAQVAFFRRYRGLTQEQLAERMGLPQPMVSRLENIYDTEWTHATLMRVAAALDVRVSADLIPNESIAP